MATRSTVDYQAHLEKILEDIRNVVHDGEDLLKTGTAAAREKAVAGAKAADSYVRDHPYQSLGIGLGVGLVLGLIASNLLASGGGSDEDSEDY